ncbi:MAG: VanZ family protein [Erysipelotrichaceae bacterium]|nr:VanZ family protein [Erysipelotrichaceae bacterium]
MLFIFIMSSFNGIMSSNQSGSIATLIYNIFNISDTAKVSFIIRKCAHVSDFFILGILVINLISKYNVKYSYLISFIICVLYASSDEFHQLFVPGRSGQVTDVLIDLIGVVLGLSIYCLIKYFKSLRL